MTLNYCEFNHDFFLNENISWYNRKGVYKLDDEINVTIELVTNGVHKTYKGYLVSIIHKTNGKIDSEYFDFDAYMSIENRIDDRSDYPGGFSIVQHVCAREGIPKWYIAKPHNEDINYMGNMIFHYIERWRR
ncbi:hypothetical protein [Alkalihalobacillus sp. BA299]|uniref:hypothetical protein n=1 Tax=Alkalihalobacillus sp. BA299 TaxID=2815938 RepID=UPI001ADC87F6|nr:hypothetical protein [Alkalihalobacillus sp. BA299]